MIESTSQYEAFKARQAVLAGLIDRAAQSFRELNMDTWAEAAEKLGVRVQNDRFRVMILGEFKRGKSTFINALLAAEILPSSVDPCTAVINEVKWGEPARALLHFREPMPEKMHPLPPDAKRHLDKHRAGPVPAMEIPINDLQEFVRIPDPSAGHEASVAASPYDRVELFWPLALCKNGVEIIDSPGLNEHHTRTKTTRDYLSYIDAVVFVFSVHALASDSELSVIDNDLRPSGHEYLFFVCNRYDELRKREDREKIAAHAFAKLGERTRFGREGIFFLSAADALEGRMDGDSAKVNRSGIVPLEKALERFLVEDRGRVKLLQPAGNLSRGLRVALSEVVPARRKMLDEDSATLRLRLDEARPLLEQAAKKRDAVLKQVEAARMRVRDAVRREAERFFADLSQDVPMWTRNLSIVARVSSWPIGRQQQADLVAKEVVTQLAPKIELSLEEWQRKHLRPLIQQQMTELMESLQLSLDPFLEYLEGVKARLTGEIRPINAVAPTGGITTGGLMIGASGVALGGALILASTTNIAAVVAGAGVAGAASAVAAKVGALLLSMANPITLGAVIVGALALGHRQGTALTNQVISKVAEGVAAQLRTEARDRSSAIAEEVFQQTQDLSTEIALGLDRELRQVREQVDAVIREKDKGEAEVQRQRQFLAAQESTLRSTADDLNDLILSLGQGGK